mmetsp:Transcript_33851/g.73256  ORF Transcript_33851/g.73256 Transcript_33851/m.73256 type:complete len:200 (-) Transcript_33851:294-893(-)
MRIYRGALLTFARFCQNILQPPSYTPQTDRITPPTRLRPPRSTRRHYYSPTSSIGTHRTTRCRPRPNTPHPTRRSTRRKTDDVRNRPVSPPSRWRRRGRGTLPRREPIAPGRRFGDTVDGRRRPQQPRSTTRSPVRLRWPRDRYPTSTRLWRGKCIAPMLPVRPTERSTMTFPMSSFPPPSSPSLLYRRHPETDRSTTS